MIRISELFDSKTDYIIKNILSQKKVKSIPVIIIAKKPIDSIIESRLIRLGLKIKYRLGFINSIAGNFPTRNIDKLTSILEIKRVIYDNSLHLMGSTNSIKDSYIKYSYYKSDLCGKGVGIAFVDSGVFPHPDLTHPRNRITAFCDFINNIENPYDDSGHGTAVIGCACGRSIDGNFLSLAYESSIICAKAFNSLGIGLYSDILASMQWILDIKDIHSIKITVLPFGTKEIHLKYDILSIACEAMWKKGIFIVSCSGNLGSFDQSVTSPGSSPYVYTAAGCDISDYPIKNANFSGRGPSIYNIDKPDCIMPCVSIPTLNANTLYIPNKKDSDKIRINPCYTYITGTSVAAALTGAACAILYEKREIKSPDEAKSILKKCTTSLNLLKNIQGNGIIDISKIESL